jgi:hypothetical protein
MSSTKKNSKKSKVGNRKAGSRMSQREKNDLIRLMSGGQQPPKQPRKVHAPIASAKSFQQSNPRILQTNIKSCRIRHREFVDYIYFNPSTGPAFLPVQYPINAGSDQTFSWLSNIAINWERYKFHKLSFHFLTRTATTALGSILMAPDYDAADAAPVDELTMMSYQDAREDAVWRDQVVNCDLQSLDGGRRDHFVRSAALAQNLDIKPTIRGIFGSLVIHHLPPTLP